VHARAMFERAEAFSLDSYPQFHDGQAASLGPIKERVRIRHHSWIS
jgi:hypothetical protein